MEHIPCGRSMVVLQIFFSVLVLLAIIWFLKIKNHLVSASSPILRILSIILNAHSLNDVATCLFHTFGETITLKDRIFTRTDIVATCNPQNLDYILKTNFSNYLKGNTSDIFGDTLFTTDTDQEQYPARKKMAHRILSSKEFRSFAVNESQRVVEFALLPLLVHLAKESIVVDLQDVFLRLTYVDSFIMVFGINPKLLCPNFGAAHFVEAIDVAMNTIIRRHLVPTIWWKVLRKLKLGLEGRYLNARRTIDYIIEDMISQWKENEFRDKAGGPKDLMSIWTMFKESGENEESPRDITFGMLTAIADTNASGLTWFFWLVCQNPRVEAKILDELTQVQSGRTKKLSKMELFDQEELKNLVYLHAAICEALRLYPPVSINHRAAVKDDVLPDGTRVRPGTKVILCTYAMARQKWIWGEDCMDFRPERWINEDGKILSQLMSNFFVFNAGPRACMGKDMAFSLMKGVIANILFNFNVHVVNCNPELHKLSIFLYMQNGLKVKITERIWF